MSEPARQYWYERATRAEAELAAREQQLQDYAGYGEILEQLTERAEQAEQQLTSLREAAQDLCDHTADWSDSGRLQRLREALAAAGDQQDSQ